MNLGDQSTGTVVKKVCKVHNCFLKFLKTQLKQTSQQMLAVLEMSTKVLKNADAATKN